MLLSACGTGIEVTEHVTDKDVKRAITQTYGHESEVQLDAFVDSVPAWKAGKKRFWVADNQVRLLLNSEAQNLADTSSIAGHVLVYDGYETGSLYDNRENVNIRFRDENTTHTYVYSTGKTIDEFGRSFTIPMLIDLDMVNHVARQIVDKDYYIRTSIWYDCLNGQMTNGRHFIKVHIDSVGPGNAITPLRVIFTTADTGQKAMVWMSESASMMKDRVFSALFDIQDPHVLYPAITDKNWELITRAQVVEGMTKDECRLALGNPKRTSQNPDQGGLREYWYYDGGSYLFFVDGLLVQFRR